ncbi:MAG: HD-GYP domain-containing protein [Chloroflexota bacterium]
MKPKARRLPGQPYIALGIGLGAFAALWASWILGPATDSSALGAQSLVLGLALILALVLTYHFPIHVGDSSKVYASGTVLFLMAVLLPPMMAASTIGIGIVAGEIGTCNRTANHRIPSIIPTQAARWVIIGLAGSLVTHSSLLPSPLPLIAGGLLLWSGDILSGPLLLSPLLGQSPAKVMEMMVRQGGVFEGVQYAVGLLGALVVASDPWALILLALPAGLIYTAFKRSHDLRQQTRRALEDMADAADRRSSHRGGHSRRVSALTRELVAHLDVSASEARRIVLAARLHDVGKIGIPEGILPKQECLNVAERAVLQSHVEAGAQMLARYPEFSGIVDIVRHHHEAWDGSGYPDHLSKDDIPLGARIVAVVNAYDTIDARENGRAARRELLAGRGTQWSPDIVDLFLRTLVDESLDDVPLRLVPRMET